MLMVNRLGIGGSFGRADSRCSRRSPTRPARRSARTAWPPRSPSCSELQAQLEHQAFHDPLTGLANRLLFMDRVDHTLQRRQGNAGVIYIDLDDFKPINDTYGHEAGDAVLVAAAERLRDSLRAADTAARLGGDEFAVLLVDIAEEHIAVVADRIIDNLVAAVRVRRPRARGQGEHRRRLANTGAGVDADELVRNADVAMYVSKHGGKGAQLSNYERRLPRLERSRRASTSRSRSPMSL